MVHLVAPHLRPPRLVVVSQWLYLCKPAGKRPRVAIMLAASLPACWEWHTCSCGYEGRIQTGARRRAACGMRAARVQGAEALLVDMIVTHASTQTNFSSLDDGLLVGLCCSNLDGTRLGR